MSGYTTWFCGNVTGALVGSACGVADWGADYLLIAMFAALLMLNLASAGKKQAALGVLVIAALLSVGLERYHPSPLNILLAAGFAAAMARDRAFYRTVLAAEVSATTVRIM